MEDEEYQKTVPKKDTYAYWAGLNVSVGAIVTAAVAGVMYLLAAPLAVGIFLALGAGLLTILLIPHWFYPTDLK